MNVRAQAILRLDAGAAAVAGLSMLVLRAWLAVQNGFAPGLVLFVGLSNLAYASYSGALALRAYLGKTPARRAIDVLVAANLIWAGVCAAIFAATFRTASGFGLAHVAVEGVFVGGLALVERRLVRPYAR